MANIIKQPVTPSAAPAKQGTHTNIGTVPDSKGIVHRKVVDAQGRADEIVAAAEARAAEIRGVAEKVLADAKIAAAESVKRGFADGETKGIKLVSEKLVAIEQIKERFYEGAEPQVVKLVMEVAEKIVGQLAVENLEMIRSVVRLALERAIGDQIIIKVNPIDYQALSADGGAAKDLSDRTRRISFRPDDAISQGGCIVESEVGTIDARLEIQLEAIRKALGLVEDKGAHG